MDEKTVHIKAGNTRMIDVEADGRQIGCETSQSPIVEQSCGICVLGTERMFSGWKKIIST